MATKEMVKTYVEKVYPLFSVKGIHFVGWVVHVTDQYGGSMILDGDMIEVWYEQLRSKTRKDV